MAEAIQNIRTLIRAKAKAAHAAGQTLDQCTLPPHSAAYATFAAEYARLASPSSHAAPIGRQRVDQAQGASC